MAQFKLRTYREYAIDGDPVAVWQEHLFSDADVLVTARVMRKPKEKV